VVAAVEHLVDLRNEELAAEAADIASLPFRTAWTG
jgi:hypothetical protein